MIAARITPACAGNSTTPPPVMVWVVDHPRVCGEQGFGSNFGTCNIGSPPRVRGTVKFNVLGYMESGITPACAGNRLFRVCSFEPCTDHPRVCGEQ